ncbi:MAG: lytic transglycosylase domain-containing protein, partial [Acidobacteria bacterium]|nr:lytic transglycosylase domain-containing protein [Acidobacteriota bacterium]
NSNGTTDIGLMQINSWWLRVLGLDERELIENPCHNVKTGARILSQCIDRYGYNWKAVGCYNAYSEHKKILYSWKIYNELKKAESDRKQAVADEKPVLEKARKSELHFTVKEILPYCAGEEP